MTIQKAEKQKKYLSSLLKFNLIYLLLFCSAFSFGQDTKKKRFQLEKIGFLYNYGKQGDFIILNNTDYFYQTNVYKLQLFYPIVERERWSFTLIAQPQIHHMNHKLLNEHYVKPSTPDYLEKRALYTQLRSMTLTAFEIGSLFKLPLYKKLSFEGTIGLGVAYIDTVSERLAKGFTFIENFSFGFSHPLNSSEIYLGTNFGHVSNLNFQQPNDGYNITGLEFGYRFYIK